jgi:microcystin-dependent protein
MRPAWLTPDVIPSAKTCRVLHIPDNEKIIASVTGALRELEIADNWEEHGAVSPDEIATAMYSMLQSYLTSGGDCVPVGSILPFGGADVPVGWLGCDGEEVAQADYPCLYDILGDAWGVASPGNFKLPDLRGRALIGVGSGAGLTPRALADVGGEEAHTLTEGEMPVHAHTAHSHVVNVMTGVEVVPAAGADIPGTLTGYAGSGGAHQTMQPWAAVQFIIRAR